MVEALIEGDPTRRREAEAAACAAVAARLTLWDGVLLAMQANRRPSSAAALAANVA
jgi:hypothetical protein